jgi:ribonuclease HI
MTTESPHAVHIFTDGACSGNPGPGGWGALLRYGSKERELFGGEPDTTNNRMELTAVIRGLDAMTRAVTVHVHTDSTYVMQGMTKWIHGWKKNGWRTSSKEPVKNADLWQLLEASVGRHTVHWHWVKGHNGHEGNERADALANKGVESVRPPRGTVVERSGV